MTDPNYKEAAWELRRRAAAATSVPVGPQPTDGISSNRRFHFTPEQLAHFEEEGRVTRERLKLAPLPRRAAL